MISKSIPWTLSSRFANAVWASSEAASALASLPWDDLSSAEHASKSASSMSSSFWSSICSPPVSAIADEISDSSALADSSRDSASDILETRSSRFCLSITTSALFLEIESSKLVLKPCCSSRSASAASRRSFLVARSILACSIFALRSLYSGPILAAISSSFSEICLSFSARCDSSSALAALSVSMRPSSLDIWSATPFLLACSIWSFLWEYWALAISSAAWASRYALASSRSLSRRSTWWVSSSTTIPILSRLVSASDFSFLAFSMSASKLAIPEIASMMRLLSMAPIWTMRVTSPCWTRLYPSALILALVRRPSNSVMVDLRSLT